MPSAAHRVGTTLAPTDAWTNASTASRPPACPFTNDRSTPLPGRSPERGRTTSSSVPRTAARPERQTRIVKLFHQQSAATVRDALVEDPADLPAHLPQ